MMIRNNQPIEDLAVLNYHAGDTGESVIVQIVNSSNRQPQDLTDATARFRMSIVNDDSTVVATIDQPAVILEDGKIQYSWRAGDLAVPGQYQGLFVVTYDDGTIESYPRQGFIDVQVE